MKNIVVKVNDAVKTIAKHQVITEDGKPTVLNVTNKVNYELEDQSTGFAPDHIIIKRVGKDLHVSIEEAGKESDLVIEDFYAKTDSALIGQAEDGSYFYFVPDTGEVADFITELAPGDIVGQALGGASQSTPYWIGATESNEGFAWLPWLAGFGAIVAIAAIANDDDDDDNNLADTTAPNAPTIDSVTNDNTDTNVTPGITTITGKTEPGSTVTVTDKGGNVIGETKANNQGDYIVDVPALAKDEVVNVTATDNAGNESKPTKVAGLGDDIATTKPTEAPVVTDNVADDGSVLDPAEVILDSENTNDNTPSVTILAAQHGDNDTPQLVIDGQVVAAQIVENADGSVTLTPTDAVTDGEHELSYSVKDVNGITSGNAPFTTVVVDTQPPADPTMTVSSEGGIKIMPADEDTTEVVVDYKDEIGDDKTVIAIKDLTIGEWTTNDPLPSGVKIDPTTGEVKIPAADVDTNKDITASGKDDAGNLATTIVTGNNGTDDVIVDIATVTSNAWRYEDTGLEDGGDEVIISGNVQNNNTGISFESSNEVLKVGGNNNSEINIDESNDEVITNNQLTGNVNDGTGEDTLNSFATNSTDDISLNDVINAEVVNLKGSGRELDDVNSSNLTAVGNDLYIQGKANDYVDIGDNNGKNSNDFADSNSSNWSITDAITDVTDSSITYDIWTNDTTNQYVYIQDTINVI